MDQLRKRVHPWRGEATPPAPFHKQASGNIFKDDVYSFFRHLGYFLLWYFLRIGFLTFSKKCTGTAIDDRPEDRRAWNNDKQRKTSFFLSLKVVPERRKVMKKLQKTSKISLSKNFTFKSYAADPGGNSGKPPHPPPLLISFLACTCDLCRFHF